MPAIETPPVLKKPARQTLGRRNYYRRFEKTSIPAPSSELGWTPASAKRDRWWLTWISLLNVPSLVFLLFYVFSVPGDAAGLVSLAMAETLALLGLFGASMTFAAFLLTMTVTMRGEVSWKTGRMLWALMALTFCGWLYIWISFSILFHAPPLVPFLTS
jgi:hypothetical protein